MFLDHPNPTVIELEQVSKQRTSAFDHIYESFNQHYDEWMKNLETCRAQCCLLNLFSNRQIMILIILLQQSPSPTSIRRRFLEKIYSFRNTSQQQNNDDEEQKFAIQCLRHYLSSIRIQQANNFEEIYKLHQIDAGRSSEARLKNLAEFLNALFNDGQELMERQGTIDPDQQFLIPLTVDEENLDITTFNVLIDLLNQRLPSSFQILWCTTATNEDIKLFFSRIRKFRYLTFLIIDIDKMHHRLREILLSEQDCLTREQVEHGTIFYFSKELTTSRSGLRQFHMPAKDHQADSPATKLKKLFQTNKIAIPLIRIIYGAAGIGKIEFN